MTVGNSDSLMSDINVTPFVDVMLVLLIIFMVAAPMMEQGVKVDLPEAKTEALPSDQEYLIITVNKKQQIFINKYESTLDSLQDKLSKILQNRKDRKVYLKADKTIPYGMVVKVMAEVKEAGVDNLGMVTTPISGNPDTK
jgi:biopolymer transport protein TolR